MNQEYPYGDFAWFAVDARGHIGAFLTAAEGSIPRAWIENRVVKLFDIEDVMLALPVRSQVVCSTAYKKMDCWYNLSERGIFCYDWKDVYRPTIKETHVYEKVCQAFRPLRVSDLDARLADCFESIGVFDLSFDEAQTVDPHRFTPCVSRPP